MSPSSFVDNWEDVKDFREVSSWTSGWTSFLFVGNIRKNVWTNSSSAEPDFTTMSTSHNDQSETETTGRNFQRSFPLDWWLLAHMVCNIPRKLPLFVWRQDCLSSICQPVRCGTGGGHFRGVKKEKLFKTQHVCFVDEQHILSISGVGLLYFQTLCRKAAASTELPLTRRWPDSVCASFA